MRFVIAVTVLGVAFGARAEDLRSASERAAAEIARALAASANRAGVKQVAVPPFTESGAAKGLGPMAADAAGARLAQLANVEVIDRAKLSALVGERKLQVMMGAGKADDADLATRSGAQAVLAGEVQDAGDRLRVSLRLVSTPGNKVLASASASADLPSRGGSGRAGGAVESEHIEVAVRRLSDGLAAGFARLPGNAMYRRLAVLTFTENGDEAQKRKIGSIVTAEVATNLRRDHNLLLVERAKLREVLGELKLQQMVSVDSSQAGQIGKMADAQALVIGSVSEAGDRFLVNARIVATQSGETLAAESTAVPAAGMVALASDAVVLRSRTDAVYRSLLLPGWGQFYNRQPVKAWAVIGTELALGGAALGYHLAGQSAYDKYQNANTAGQLGGQPSVEAERLYDDAASRFRTRNTLLLAFGGVWLLNVADAWLSGVDGERLLSGGVAQAPVIAPVAFPGGAGAVAMLRF
jgi:TolB-like protein